MKDGEKNMKPKCESCRYFIPNVTIIDEYGFTIYGYGCTLGGSYLSRFRFFNGCKDYKKTGRMKCGYIY